MIECILVFHQQGVLDDTPQIIFRAIFRIDVPSIYVIDS